jgi:hypothetical protein
MRSLRNPPSYVRLWRWAGLTALCLQACLNPIPDEEPSAQDLAPGEAVGAAGAANQPNPSGGMPAGGSGATSGSPPAANQPESQPPAGAVDAGPNPPMPDAGPAADAGVSDGGA